MYLLEGRKSSADGGAAGPLLIGPDNEAIIALLSPRWRELVRHGKVFFASNQAGIASPAGLTASSLNFTLYNPIGSGKILSLIEIIGQNTLDPAADAAWCLVANLVSTAQTAPATVTAEIVRNARLLGPAGAGVVYNTCTLPSTPVVIRPLFSVPWASGAGFAQTHMRDSVDGQIEIVAGIPVSIQATAAITGRWSMVWAEYDE